MIKQKIKGEVYTLRKITNNLHRYIELATEQDIEEGLNWYPEANEFCRVLANKHGLTMQQVAGITSAMSPQCSWSVNRQLVNSFLDSGGKAKVTTHERVNKAKKMLKTTDYEEIMSLLSVRENGALKTRAFYDSICRPTETDLVVIDRHQIAASLQRPDATHALDANMAQITPVQYNFLSECTREVARSLGWTYSATQALIWISYRKCRNLFAHKPDTFVAMDIENF